MKLFENPSTALLPSERLSLQIFFFSVSIQEVYSTEWEEPNKLQGVIFSNWKRILRTLLNKISLITSKQLLGKKNNSVITVHKNSTYRQLTITPKNLGNTVKKKETKQQRDQKSLTSITFKRAKNLSFLGDTTDLEADSSKLNLFQKRFL